MAYTLSICHCPPNDDVYSDSMKDVPEFARLDPETA